MPATATTYCASRNKGSVGDVMSRKLIRRRVTSRPRRRLVSLVVAVALTMLLALSSCAPPDGSLSAAGDSDSDNADTRLGWSLFRAASGYWELKYASQHGGPPWAWKPPPVSTYGPNARAAKEYRGKLPFNTIIAPTSPVTVLSAGEFGWRDAPDQDGRELHNGTDISVGEGLPVVSAMDGVVEDVLWDVWGGNRVEVVHDGGMMSSYNHLKDVQVKERDELKASQQLGTVGQTGTRVTGPHLHFEMWVKGDVVDPRTFHWRDGSKTIPAPRKPQPQNEIPIEDRAPSDPGKPCPAGQPQAVNCTPLHLEEELCPPTDPRRGDCLPREELPPSFPPLEECESLGQGQFNCDPFDRFPGPEDCPPAVVEGARTDCPTVPPDLNNTEQCVPTVPGAFDCVPFGTTGPEDCPPADALGARTDCPAEIPDPRTTPTSTVPSTPSFSEAGRRSRRGWSDHRSRRPRRPATDPAEEHGRCRRPHGTKASD